MTEEQKQDKNSTKDTILINIMYTGDYTNKNIGHEIINLYKSDNGNNYIYISPYGLINKERTDIKYVILARPAGKEKLEILAKAEVEYPEQDGQKLSFSQNAGIKHPDKKAKIKYKNWEEERKKLHQKHLDFIENKKIEYGGKALNKIFEKNEWDETSAYITFTVKKLEKPSKRIYIIDKENRDEINTENSSVENEEDITFTTHNVGFRNTSCIKYLNNNHRIYDYFKEQIIEDKDSIISWEEFSTPSLNDNLNNQNITFIEIMGKQNDELAYSNMLAYFLSDDVTFKQFAKDVLKKNEIKTDKTFEIKREEGKIDLLVITDDDVFIIENKIKSGINGIKYDYYNNTYTNQLCEYYEKINKKYKDKKDIHCFIFHPKYNNIDKTKLKKFYTSEANKPIIDKYTSITYGEILGFFEKLNSKNIELLKQFKEALKLHDSDVDNSIQREMEYKFKQAIINAKNGED